MEPGPWLDQGAKRGRGRCDTAAPLSPPPAAGAAPLVDLPLPSWLTILTLNLSHSCLFFLFFLCHSPLISAQRLT